MFQEGSGDLMIFNFCMTSIEIPFKSENTSELALEHSFFVHAFVRSDWCSRSMLWRVGDNGKRWKRILSSGLKPCSQEVLANICPDLCMM